MKKLLLSLVMVLSVFALQSQPVVIFEDNFDSYTAGTALTVQNHTNWTTWSGGQGGAEDPMISTAQAQSTPNSVYITGSNDIIYKFTNQTNGAYKIEFDYYVPSSGQGGYFNMQHYANPGQQWAFEVYFRNNGTGYLLAGSSTQNAFNFPINQWFHIICDVDLNNDEAKLTINGVAVKTWPFHYQAGSQNGINQLGSINFYAGSPVGTSTPGTYYLDNYKFSQIDESIPPQFVITPNEDIVKDVIIALNETETINLSNPGGAALDYDVVAVYDIPNPNPASTGVKTVAWGDYATSGVGFTNQDHYTVAVGYTPSMLKDHIGKTVRKYGVDLNNTVNIVSAKLCIWEMGPMGMPSIEPPIYEQTIPVSSLFDGYNSITLQTPWLIDGRYLYIGLDMITIPGDNTVFVSIGTDDTPDNQCNKLGRLYRSTVAWTAISGLAGYWDMDISVDGTPINPWMTLDHTAATLQPLGEKDLTITFGATDILENCTKQGQLYFFATTNYDEPEAILGVTVNFISGTEVEYIINITTETGESPAGATVTLTNDYKTYKGTSNDTGVTFPNVLCGTYSLTVTLPGFKEHSETIVITEDDVHYVELQEIVFTIIITTKSGDTPFGAEVTLSNTDNTYEDASDDIGVIFHKVVSGTYSLKIILEGFTEYNETGITITEAGTLEIELLPLSIGDSKYGFSLYPNPVIAGSINIETANINTVEIYTLMGQKVYSSQFSCDKVEISTANLTVGTYMVKVINAEGKTATQKLIVK